MSELTGVAHVRLRWPERRNALTPETADLLRTELVSAGEDSAARCILLSADGPTFCAGGDLRRITELAAEGREALRGRLYRSFQGLLQAIRTSPIPIVVAVEQPAIGLGVDLVLACQIRVLAQTAWFRQGWAALGLISAPGGVWDQSQIHEALPWRLLAAGERRIPAMELASLTGDVVSTDAYEAALGLCRTLAGYDRQVLTTNRRLQAATELSSHLEMALEAQVDFLTADRFRERVDTLLGGLPKTPSADQERRPKA